MNRELKRLCQIAGTIFLVIILFINIRAYLDSGRFIPEASRVSQVHNTNLLRKAKLNKSSELKNYPNLKKQRNLHLIAEPGMQKVFVLSGHKVIYIMHAQIYVSPQTLTSQTKSGQQLFHIDGQTTITAQNWTEFGQHYYFESLSHTNQQAVKKKWLAKPVRIPNTIQLSTPDAKWVQTLPQGTTITIR